MPDPAAPGAMRPVPALDLSRPARIHIVGAGGAGMRAIATVLVAMGHAVSGSDLTDSASLRGLAALGVATHVGHDAAALGDAQVMAISTAVPASNVEVLAARRRGIPVLRRAEILAAICATRRTLAVAGTHGKTTTSSMLARILSESSLEPSYIIGGEIHGVGSGAAWSSGSEWLVVEADESDGTFLELPVHGALVTSIEPDHLDHYGSFDRLLDAFDSFSVGATGPRVIAVDDPAGAALAARLAGQRDRATANPVITYGTSPGADYHIGGLERGRDFVRFELIEHGTSAGTVTLRVPGDHNARNGCGAVAISHAIGVPLDQAVAGLGHYQGVARRFEWRGDRNEVTYVDDYGHLPGEVAAAVATGRAGGWKRVVAVFQPHRYSRTAALWADFADAFVDADVVVVTDVYPAGELPRAGVSGRLIADAVLAAHPGADVVYLPGRQEILEFLRPRLVPGDLCLTLGAGDLTTLPDQLLGQGPAR